MPVTPELQPDAYSTGHSDNSCCGGQHNPQTAGETYLCETGREEADIGLANILDNAVHQVQCWQLGVHRALQSSQCARVSPEGGGRASQHGQKPAHPGCMAGRHLNKAHLETDQRLRH